MLFPTYSRKHEAQDRPLRDTLSAWSAVSERGAGDAGKTGALRLGGLCYRFRSQSFLQFAYGGVYRYLPHRKEPDTHKNHVLFINALNEVTRKNAQSYLEPHHIERISKAYRAYKTEEGFAKKISIRDIEKNDFSLNIPLYVQIKTNESITDTRTIQECFNDWKESSQKMRKCYSELSELLKEGV